MKRDEGSPRSASGGSSLEGSVLSQCPTLVAYLTDSAWDDGSKRETSTLTVFAEHGRIKLCLNDRENGRSAWVSGRTLEDALAGLEADLAGGEADWRKSYQKKGK